MKNCPVQKKDELRQALRTYLGILNAGSPCVSLASATALRELQPRTQALLACLRKFKQISREAGSLRAESVAFVHEISGALCIVDSLIQTLELESKMSEEEKEDFRRAVQILDQALCSYQL